MLKNLKFKYYTNIKIYILEVKVQILAIYENGRFIDLVHTWLFS